MYLYVKKYLSFAILLALSTALSFLTDPLYSGVDVKILTLSAVSTVPNIDFYIDLKSA
jgi:hypothetical protein